MKKILFAVGVASVLCIVYYSTISCQTNKPKNLKVIKDRDMTIEEMKEYMRNFTLSLGVECDYCHDTDNYSSDDKKEKNITRDMMLLTEMLNDKYFANAKDNVTCYTCHRGSVRVKNIPPGL